MVDRFPAPTGVATFAGMTAPLATKRVLVVDDERSIAAAVVRRLEREGAACAAAHSGSEGLDQLAAERWDLVITDVTLPGRSGLEILDEARRMVDPPAMIVMLAPDDGVGSAEVLARGADAIVAKPLDVELVAHEASLALELRTMRQTVEAIGAARAAGPILVVLGEIVNAFEKADPYRAGYSNRTSRIAVALAGPLGLDADRVAIAARVHDVGMLAVPITEQHAEGPPTRTTHHLIRVHPTLGARWIERLGADRSVVGAVAAHHERQDGGGYPGGLAGDDIPPLARALGTAAAIAAMCAARPWRARREPDAVITELVQGRESQFGAAEVDAAVDLLRRTPTLLT
jgi:putative two-component system response regulator